MVALTGEPRGPAGAGGGGNGPFGAGAGDLRTRVFSVDGVPRADPGPKLVVWPAEQRVGELTERRTAASRVFQLADGRLQQEFSSLPLHYRAADGSWQAIDTTVAPTARPGFAFGNETNQFRSFFGGDPAGLVRFETGAGALTLAVPGGHPDGPAVDGSVVTYRNALGTGMDLSYEVTAQALKEKIIIGSRPESGGDLRFTFGLGADGLHATQRRDGSIVFGENEDGAPALVMPAPFMMDSADDPSSPYGAAWSRAVSQSLSGSGSQLSITVTANADWLADPARKFPVVIDPTIKIAPTPTESQDTMVLSDASSDNYDSSWHASRSSATTASPSAYASPSIDDTGRTPTAALVMNAAVISRASESMILAV